MKIKICGIRSNEDVQLINKYKPDFIGFIFYKKSPRYLDFDKAKEIKSELNHSIKTVGVFVNEDLDTIILGFKNGVYDYVQLHGDEGQDQINSLQHLGIPVIKAIKVEDIEDFNETSKYQPDYFLFDVKDKKLVGGTGRKFDWNLLKYYKGTTPYFLAGGINSDNIDKTLSTKAEVLDVSTGVEINYKKNPEKIKELFKEYNRLLNLKN